MLLGHLSSKKTSVEWTIENIFNQKDQGGIIKSPYFLLSDARFFIEIYPYGKTVANVGWVSFYLFKFDSPSDVHIECSMRLKKSVDGTHFKFSHFNHLFPAKAIYGWGFPRFMRHSQLTTDKNILGPSGTVTIFCDFRVADDSTTDSESQTTVPDNLTTLSRNFENIFVNGCCADASIDIKGKKFLAHRAILSSRSSVFRSIFENNMSVKHTGSVNVTDCVPESFRSFLLFLYSGNVDVATSDNTMDLYILAKKYDVQDLEKACCECMARDLCVASVCDVASLAALHGEKELLENATKYFVNNASEILKSQKWETFVVENFDLANELLIKMAEK